MKSTTLSFNVMSFRSFLALSIIFANFCAEYECQTSRHGKVQNRVVGGFDCSMATYPFFVLITKSGVLYCGGSIVHKNWIVSAAHCFEELSSPSELELQSDTENRTAIKIVTHPEFNITTADCDIGMVKFSSQVDRSFSESDVIKLPSSLSETDNCRKPLLMGWGRQTGTVLPTRPPNKTARAGVIQDPKNPSSFKCVRLDMASNAMCYYMNNRNKPKSIFCANWPTGGKGVCMGDSGGPVVSEEESDGALVLIGVISSSYLCALPVLPSTHMRVDFFLDFIRNTINSANIGGKSLMLLCVCTVASCVFMK